jgi:hypothetical protein
MPRGGFVLHFACLKGRLGALRGNWGHSVSRKERKEQKDRKGREREVLLLCVLCVLCDLCALCVAFSIGAEVALSISSGALRFCDDKCAARISGVAISA